MVKKGEMLDVNDVIDILSVDLIGVIPDDETIVTSSNRGEPISLNGKSTAAQALRNIAKRIEGEEVPFLDLNKGTGFFARLFGKK